MKINCSKMRIKSIELENIRSYKHQKIDFSPGTTLLWGDIGAGKSTILYAIEFALFGSKGTELSASSLLRHGTNSGSITLEFEIEDKEYIIKRSLKRSKTGVTLESNWLSINGNTLNLSTSEMKARIFNILGYPENIASKFKDEIFRFTVYTPQEEMKKILIDKEKRIEVLRRLFNLDKYKIIRENCQIFLRELRQEKKEIEIVTKDYNEIKREIETLAEEISKLKILLEEKEKNLEQYNSRKNNLNKEIQDIEMKIQEIRTTFTLLETNNKILSEKLFQLDKWKNELKKVCDEIEKSNAKIAKIEIKKNLGDKNIIKVSIENKEKELVTLRLRKKQLDELLKEKQKLLDYLKSEEKVEDKYILINEINVLTENLKEKEELNFRLENCKKKVNEELILINSLEKEITEANNIIATINSLDICPKCGQRVSEIHKQKIYDEEKNKIFENNKLLEKGKKNYSELILEIERLEKKIEELAKSEIKVIELRQKILEIEKKENQIEENKKKIKQIEEELYTLMDEKNCIEKTDFKLIENEIVSLKKQLEEIENEEKKRQQREALEQVCQEKEKLKKTLEINIGNAQSSILELEKQNNELRLKTKDFDILEENLKTKKIELEITEKEIIKLNKDLSELKIRIENSYSNKEKLDQKIKSMDSMLEKKEIISEIISFFENHFLQLVDNIELQVLGSIYVIFNEYFSEWFRQLIEDEEIAVRLDDTFSPIVEQNGFETDVTSLSGGERTSCALAYRLALNKVLNDLISTIYTKDIIILDEPTDGFSSTQLDRMRNVIEMLNFGQIIIVSHETKMESFVDNIIKIRKLNHQSILE